MSEPRWYRVGLYTTNSKTGAAAVAQQDRLPVEVLSVPDLKPTGEAWRKVGGQWQRVMMLDIS